MSVKITIIYDNMKPAKRNLRAGWGFSAILEIDQNYKILFDTGADGENLLHNMNILGFDPRSINAVFISHAHLDHVGGLIAFLRHNHAVKVWLPPSMKAVPRADEVVVITNATQLRKGVYSTGELEGIEQSMVVETALGLIIMVGCSHPSMENIRAKASLFGEVYGIVGGLHGTRPEALQGLSLICATHCTRHKDEIKRFYPEAYMEGGAGTVIEI